MPERTKQLGQAQGFVEFISGLDPKEAAKYITGTGSSSVLTAAGLKKMKKYMQEADRIKEFQSVMLPIITAMLQKDVYNPDSQTSPYRDAWQQGRPRTSAPGTYAEGRNRYEEIAGS